MIARIAVGGSWHLASVLASGLAELGHSVVGCDDDADAIAGLAAARAPADEPGLAEVMRAELATGRLRYTTDWVDALRGVAFAFVAHDTPVRDDDSPDIAIVERTVRQMAAAASAAFVLVVSSQVPVGTTARLRDIARAARPDLAWDAAYVPEFLQLGQALDRFRHPDRLVIGAQRPAIADAIASLYPPSHPVIRTDLATAEMTKHATNAFLATSISFINEVSDLCEASGADALTVADAMRLDRRIGRDAFLTPGLGFAGGTLGRDVRALEAIGRIAGRPTPLLDAAIAVNASRLPTLLARIREAAGERRTAVACLLGLTYKPGTSTLRRSVSLEVARTLLASGWTVRAHDPAASSAWSSELPAGLDLREDAFGAADGAHVAVLLTEWPQYRALDLRRLRRQMAGDALIDARNAIDPRAAATAGLRYRGMGRGAPTPVPA